MHIYMLHHGFNTIVCVIVVEVLHIYMCVSCIPCMWTLPVAHKKFLLNEQQWHKSG